MSASDRIQDASVVCSGLYSDGRRVPVRQLSISSADSVEKVPLAEMIEKGYLKEALNLIFCLVAHQVTPVRPVGKCCM
jgi:hypothetical protein